MSGALNSTEVWSVEGEVSPLAMRSAVFERAGVHGSDVVQIGRRGEPYTFILRDDLTTDDARQAKLAAIWALAGTIITVIDNHGNSYGRQLVEGFGQPIQRNALLSVGGRNGGKYLLELEIRMRAV